MPQNEPAGLRSPHSQISQLLSVGIATFQNNRCLVNVLPQTVVSRLASPPMCQPFSGPTFETCNAEWSTALLILELFDVLDVRHCNALDRSIVFWKTLLLDLV